MKLRDVEEAIGNHAPEAGELKKKFKLGKASVGIDSKNITAAARNRKKPELKIKDVHKMKLKSTNVIKLQNGRLAIGDEVKTSTTRFGDEYALGKPEFTFGVVKKIKGKLASILWEGEKRGMNSKVSHQRRCRTTLG